MGFFKNLIRRITASDQYVCMESRTADSLYQWFKDLTHLRPVAFIRDFNPFHGCGF